MMADEYIRREDAIEEINKWLDSVGTALVGKGMSYYGELIGCIEDTPAADVAPVVHGRWVDRIVDENEVIQPWMERYYCSECLEGGNQSWFKFCPNCGAKMDGGNEGE